MPRLLKKCKVINRSGISCHQKTIPTIKNHQFKKINKSVGGETPKDVLRIYKYDGNIRKDNYKTWPVYIVKVGQKWYPNESITEQLITDIGKKLGVDIASSKLLEIEGVIRFCSKHFHRDNEFLNHGATILSRYLNEPNEEWIDELERISKIKELIDVKDVISAIKHEFNNNSDSIIKDFIDMLLFDCFIGNNDRHYYNWGVITCFTKKQSPYFSPIFDTARGVWWNYPDDYIVDLCKDVNATKNKVKSYIDKSGPKITVPGNSQCSHFELIKYLLQNCYISQKQVSFWDDREILKKAKKVIDDRYHRLMIIERRDLIKKTLELRYQKMLKILK